MGMVSIACGAKDKDKESVLIEKLRTIKGLNAFPLWQVDEDFNTFENYNSTAIKCAKYFIPIITRHSLRDTRMNQHVGAALAYRQERGKPEFQPIIEAQAISELRGLLHPEIGFHFIFEELPANNRMERVSYAVAVGRLCEYISYSLNGLKANRGLLAMTT